MREKSCSRERRETPRDKRDRSCPRVSKSRASAAPRHFAPLRGGPRHAVSRVTALGRSQRQSVARCERGCRQHRIAFRDACGLSAWHVACVDAGAHPRGEPRERTRDPDRPRRPCRELRIPGLQQRQPRERRRAHLFGNADGKWALLVEELVDWMGADGPQTILFGTGPLMAEGASGLVTPFESVQQRRPFSR